MAIPVYDAEVKRQLKTLLDLQLADNRKARVIDGTGTNPYAPGDVEAPPLRSQEAFRDFVAGLADA